MSNRGDKIIKKLTPSLQIMTETPNIEAPKEIEIDEVRLKRVARPLRHVKHIPCKTQVFTTKDTPFDFSYEKKIKTPIAKNKLVVQVSDVGLNPIDSKIKNGYTNTLYGEIGIGREYCGVITHVGSDIGSAWHEGDKVMGIYYHPHVGNGSLQSSILIDPKNDPIALKPETISDEEAGGSLFCLGAAYNILNKLYKDKYLKVDSNVLINGGTSSLSLFAIQLLKRVYKINKKLVIVTSSNGPDVLKEKFPDLKDDMIFINYLTCRGKSSKPLRKMLKEQKIADYSDNNASTIENEPIIQYTQGKFDIVLDFVGGYDIIAHGSSLIHSKGIYVTTVGDYVANYKEDIFNSWDNPSANARKMFNWSFRYVHYYFDPNQNRSSKDDWLETCVKYLQEGTVKCIVDKTFDWKETQQAFKYLVTQRAQGKIILKVEQF
ncbi:protein Ast1p [Monosporozyma servazzii]